MYQDIAEKLSEISSKIQAACHQAQRSEEEIRLVAVSKLQSINVINEAYALGIKNFGENYVQELAEKSSACPKDIIWHFIGPIQSNKVNLIAKHANWVHSIDREKVARKLNDALETEGKKIHALVQVNIDFCRSIILFIVSILAFFEALILGINIKPSSIKFG